MKKIYSLLTVLSFHFLSAQSPDFSWAKNMGWIGGIGGAEKITNDGNGNLFLLGDFASSSIIFGSVTLSNSSWNSNSTICLVKYDTLGNAIWGRTAGGHFNYIRPTSIATDLSGNVYVAGSYNGDSLIFGGFTLRNMYPTSFYDNIFIVKYNTNGNVLWAKSATGVQNSSGSCYIKGISIDADGNCYATGSFSSKRMVLSGDTLSNANTNLSSTSDIFVVKYDPNGNKTWAKREGSLNNDEGNSITVKENKIYLTGDFYSKAIVFGNITITNFDSSGSYANLFIAKLDTSGNVLWAKSNKTKGNVTSQDIICSSNRLIYVSGNFTCNKLGFGNDTLLNSIGGFNYPNVFTVAIDSSGNPMWAKSPDESYEASPGAICTDPNGNLYQTGRYGSGNIKFDSLILSNSYQGYDDIFIVKYDSTGKISWGKSIGGTDNDFGRGITFANGAIYVTGTTWSSSIIFGANILTAHYAPYGHDDIYIAKLSGTCTPAIINVQPQNQYAVTGGVASFSVSASGPAVIYYQWYYGNGTVINGATSASYTTPMLSYNYNGSTYYCQVSNCNYSNSINTIIDTLKVCLGASIYTQSYNQTKAVGDSAVLYVNVGGSPFFTYQWYKNGIPVPVATSSVYITPPLTMNDSVSVYFCQITNCQGLDTIQSFPTVITVSPTAIFEMNYISKHLKVFPNPASDQLNVEIALKEKGSYLCIYDINNLEIARQPVLKSKTPVDLSYLPRGIYCIKVVHENTVETAKIIKE